jgi:hypothetical protein
MEAGRIIARKESRVIAVSIERMGRGGEGRGGMERMRNGKMANKRECV